MEIIKEGAGLCVGCTACYSVCPKGAISMAADVEGFQFPSIDADLCVECHLCQRACPVNNVNTLKEDPAEHEAAAFVAADTGVRSSCSSGGAFASMAQGIFNRGGVVYGVEFSPSFEVRHARYETMEEAKACRTSKYVQSYKGDSLKSVLADLRAGRLVLFSGVPCEVAGLKALARAKGVSTEKLVLCDLLCHGGASPLLFEDHVRFLEKRHGKLVSYNFRYKRAGANWHLHESLAATRTGEYTGRDVHAYQECFDATYANRPSCGQCKFKSMDRVGDVTLADYWGVEKWHPELDDDRGVSLVIANTVNGKQLLDGLSDVGKVVVLTDGEFTQQTLVGPVGLAKRRPEFWAYYHKNGYEATIKKFTEYGLVKRAMRTAKALVMKIAHR